MFLIEILIETAEKVLHVLKINMKATLKIFLTQGLLFANSYRNDRRYSICF
jgi:hypothetical protein